MTYTNEKNRNGKNLLTTLVLALLVTIICTTVVEANNNVKEGTYPAGDTPRVFIETSSSISKEAYVNAR